MLCQELIRESQHDFKVLNISFHPCAEMASVEPVHFDRFSQRFEFLCAGCFGFVVLPALTITKPKDSPSGSQFDVATSGGADNSAFCTMPPNSITRR